MIKFLLLSFLLFQAMGCQAQDSRDKQQTSQHVGGPCEGCEALHEYGNKALSPIDTLPGFGKAGQAQLKVTGTIYQIDGKTPAQDVILYLYHTDQSGIYPTKGNEAGWARRHGYLRGWIRTGAGGRYTFFTTMPGTYPSRAEPAHIHLTVKEPGKNEYYLDDILFENDPLLTQKVRASRQDRGGSGIVKLQQEGSMQIAKRDIILGRNIPGYK